MKKNIKIIILMLFSFLFLTGCGWEDIQKDYKDLLNEKPTCTYLVGDNNQFFSFEKMTISADYNGMYVKFDSSSKKTIIDKDGHNKDIKTPEDGSIRFSQDFLEDYLNYYKDKKKCSETVYITTDPSLREMRTNDCEGIGYCVPYKLKNNTVTNPDGTKVDCHYSTATACSKVSKEDDQFGSKVWLEFGYYKVNGVTKKYFGVGADANYNNFLVDDNESDGFYVYRALESYQILDDAIDKIWLANNKFISSSKLVVKASYGTSSMYFISDNTTDNYGNFDSGTIDKAPDIDPENQTPTTPQNPSQTIRLDYDSLCSDNDIKSAVKIIGYIILVIKWIVPLIIIVLGMIDFGKAAISNDEKAINKAAGALIRRFIAGVIIFFIPTIILAGLEVVEISKGIETEFGVCTECLFDPVNKCPVSKVSTESNSNDNNS